MAKQRIVLETTEERKSALAEQLHLQGESFSDWIEGQIEAAIAPSMKHESELLPQPFSITGLLQTDVISKLQTVDWAFTTADTRYLTHDLHPYPAKFPPQIPAQLITALSMPGDLVFDPFGGSGTTAVEAVRLRRQAISLDANPLSTLIGRVKTSFLDQKGEDELISLEALVGSYISDAAGKDENWSEKLLGSHATHVPQIPNLDKWFGKAATSELAVLRHLILSMTSGVAQQAALVSLSRIVTRVSNQDSETRYVASKEPVPIGFTLKAFSRSLQSIRLKLVSARRVMRGASVTFSNADTRSTISDHIRPASVDLIVTSPPYPNATDYHLYHRFRMFWLGFDPREFGAVEIGSHLKHQRKSTDFAEYKNEMAQVLEGCFTALQPGRFAVFVVADAIFKGEQFSTAGALSDVATKCGFEVVGIIDRPIHETKRSFAQPARRARTEQLLVLRRPNTPISVTIHGPAYKMWQYERTLQKAELKSLGISLQQTDLQAPFNTKVRQPALWNIRRTAFSTLIQPQTDPIGQPVWQKTLENGDAATSTRKDPKYTTHGLHTYKGKFYPQLAKSLLNISGIDCGSIVLDPYCGSGTVPLECLLNGYRAFGFDMNPLAAKIARAKTGILLIEPALVEVAAKTLSEALPKIEPTFALDQFSPSSHSELLSWFPRPVLAKLNFLLGRIRLLGNSRLIDYFEVIVSSIIRDVSQQEPTDLRIRRRKVPLENAPVFEIFSNRLEMQVERLSRYWSIAARQPGPRFVPSIIDGDSRLESCFRSAGIDDESVDCVVTSPPYATALPYIDTDRLSILALLGMPASERGEIEGSLTGSREIRTKDRSELEEQLMAEDVSLPADVVGTLKAIFVGNRSADVGFRRRNMPALLLRYFRDIQATLGQLHRVMKSGAMAYYVVGDSRTNVGSEWFQIPTCRHVERIAEDIGFQLLPYMRIDVTTERMLHMKNAITENDVLILRKR